MRTCSKCSQEKPLDDFYQRPDSSDGYFRRCKECCRIASSVWRTANPNYYRELDKVRNKLPERRAMNTRKSRDFRRRHPEKYSAWNKVKYALDSGKLLKKPCVVCGERKADAHHPDYSQPYYVVWLCRKHHKEAHSK